MRSRPTRAGTSTSPLLLARDRTGSITGVSPAEGLAYRSEQFGGHVTLSGRTAQPLALAAARIAREMIRASPLRDGWTLLHASAVVCDDRALLAFGSKGAGKTTTALLLASRDALLLANDRVFVKVVGDELRVLPWPSAAAIGLGLLDALGLYDVVRDRLQAGEQLHPTQHQDVTDALRRREPLGEPGGKREMKVQVFPDQFATWFGMELATGGHAAALLFPRIDPASSVPILHWHPCAGPTTSLNSFSSIMGTTALSSPTTAASTCIESYAENPVHWVKVRRPEAGRYWEEHGTWLRPPVITDDMLRTVLRRRASGESVEQIQPDLIIPTGKRKGQSPSVASIYRALAEHAKREAYPEAVEQTHADFAALQVGEVPGPRLALPDRASL
ncbi:MULTISPECIES: hypothetical protein [unclassified Streptomyces]|uniref:hypothetical protein n=1 Tax=unclassified Streptomyces TaxID=2593676 RepID=UPI003369DF73